MTTKLIGNGDIDATDVNSSDSLRMQKFTAILSGSLTGIEIESDQGGTGHVMKVAVYNDNAGEPGTVAGYSAEFEASAGLNTISLVSPVAIVAGVAYWLAFISDAADVMYAKSTGKTYRYKDATYSSSYTFPDNPAGLSSGTTRDHQIAGFGNTSTGRQFQVIVC